MIFKLILSLTAFVVSCCSLVLAIKAKRKNGELRREVETYENLYKEAMRDLNNLRCKVKEYPEPEGCKHGNWCKGCSHSITVSSYSYGNYALPTTFTVCGLDRCDKFEKKVNGQ